MIRYVISCLFFWLLAVSAGHAQSAMFTRVATAGGPGTEKSKAIVADPAGNVYIAGTYDSTCYFGGDSVAFSRDENMFLAKYNPATGFVWAVAPRATWRVQGEAIAMDNQGFIYVTGYFIGSVDFGNGFSFSAPYFNTYVAKYSSSGTLVWAKPVPGEDNNPRSIACDREGNVYVAGQFEGDLSFDTLQTSSNRSACFLLKIGANGSGVWVSQTGGSGTTIAKSVSTDPSGNIVLSGFFLSTVTFGTQNLTSEGSYDVFVSKVDISGNFSWAIKAGGTGDDQGASVICGNDGSVFINGFFENIAYFGPYMLNTGAGAYSSDMYVAKLDGDGTFLWAKSLNVSCGSNNLLCTDSVNNLYLTGTFSGMVELGPSVLTWRGYGDIYVIKMDKNGEIMYAKDAGSSYVDAGQGIAILPSGDLAVTGIRYVNTVFDSITVDEPSNGIFIATLHQQGTIVIDEINYLSSDSLDTGDWVEIRNTGSQTADLSGWKLKDGNDNNIFTVDSNTTLGPGQFLVLCQDVSKFSRIHPGVYNFTGPFIFELASNGEKVRLYDDNDLLIAQVRYYSTTPWPGIAGGSGRTIELRNTRDELSDGRNWFTGCMGGSPGRRYQACDSVGVETLPPAIQALVISPVPAADLLTVGFYSPEPGAVELQVVNATGRMVRKALFHEIRQGRNSIKISVQDLPPGIYFILVTTGRNRVTGKFVKTG
jgi:hypothetical protein